MAYHKMTMMRVWGRIARQSYVACIPPPNQKGRSRIVEHSLHTLNVRTGPILVFGHELCVMEKKEKKETTKKKNNNKTDTFTDNFIDFERG